MSEIVLFSVPLSNNNVIVNKTLFFIENRTPNVFHLCTSMPLKCGQFRPLIAPLHLRHPRFPQFRPLVQTDLSRHRRCRPRCQSLHLHLRTHLPPPPRCHRGCQGQNQPLGRVSHLLGYRVAGHLRLHRDRRLRDQSQGRVNHLWSLRRPRCHQPSPRRRLRPFLLLHCPRLTTDCLLTGLPRRWWLRGHELPGSG